MFQNEYEIKLWYFNNGIEYQKIKNAKFLFDRFTKQINMVITNISVYNDNIIKCIIAGFYRKVSLFLMIRLNKVILLIFIVVLQKQELLCIVKQSNKFYNTPNIVFTI